MLSIGTYDYTGLAKSYIAQDRAKAKTANNRLSYKGTLLYSYNSVLALLEDGVIYIAEDVEAASVTSNKHTRRLLGAAEHSGMAAYRVQSMAILEVPSNIAVTENYLYKIKHYLLLRSRARINKKHRGAQAVLLFTQLRTFLETRPLDKRTKAYKEVTNVFQKLLKLDLLG